MTGAALSLLLMAVALVAAPGPAVPRSRLQPEVRAEAARDRTGWIGQLSRFGSRAGALAAAWDLLAACLQAGMAVPVAVRAVADGLDGPAGPALRRTAELLALGADAQQAWQPALDCPSTARLARAARRSGRSGTALAESVSRLAVAQRAELRAQSEAGAQRAGVLIAGPLGLCFLPAFLAIGVIPVVLGLAAGLMQQW
jgi:pilus assembly protein TadC